MLIQEQQTVPGLSFLGGPLYRLGCRLGLVSLPTNTAMMGIAIGLLLWLILILLAVFQGYGIKFFSLAIVGIHVRVLVAIPLFFLCETWVTPLMSEFARYLKRSGIVTEGSLPELESILRRVRGLVHSPLAEGSLLLGAIITLIGTDISSFGHTAGWASITMLTGGRLNWVSGWYLIVCLPVFRFLVLRWFWRLGLWWYFLWRVEKLNLRLVAAHSDGSAGLGYLEFVQENFVPLVAAISAVYSSQFAEAISSGSMPFTALYTLIPIIVVLVAVLFAGPLLIFSRKLWICCWTGRSHYLGMASRYVSAFDDRWVQNKNVSGETQLGTPDLQSLADLTNSLNIVRSMAPIPVSRRLGIQLGAATLVPMVPLILLKYPANEVAVRLFQVLTGL